MIHGNALPDEIIEVAIEDEKRDYFTASVKKIITPSPDRIQPSCKFFGLCGGCHFQHINYRRQVQLKEEILHDCLKRITGIETELEGPMIEGNPWHYRIKGQFKVAHERIGFYRGKTREIVDINNCPLMSEKLNEEFMKVRSLCNGLDIHEIHLSRGDCSTVLLRTRSDFLSKTTLNHAVSRFVDAGFSGVCIQSKGNRVKSFGKQFITLNLGDLKYTISAFSFFQSHWKLNQTVAKFIKERLYPLKEKKILDLYAGAGNFSLSLAGDAEIIAVEENPYSVKDGRRNVSLNRIQDVTFVCSPVEKYHISSRFDTILLDPPRTGLSQAVLSRMLKAMPARIVYLSCNPATFARDLKFLLKKYAIESIRIIDFFPQTYHIEVLALLKRTNYC